MKINNVDTGKKPLSIKSAELITGMGSETLTPTSKLDCFSFSLDARECNIGSKLVDIPGSVCADCYALKGNYIKYQTVIQLAQSRRMYALVNHPQWVHAMSVILNSNRVSKFKKFRWFDSGDIPNMDSLIKIIAVAMLTPGLKHWLPTKEYRLVSQYKKSGGFIPANLVIRQSAPMINGVLPRSSGTSSMVITKGAKMPEDTTLCIAHEQDNQCLKCQACWNPEVLRIAYPWH